MLSFFFNTTNRDFALAKRLALQIAEHHPDSRVVAIGDGPVSNIHELMELNQDLIVVEGERLKKTGNIGKFTTRNFNTVLALSNSPFIVKLDPDSFLRKPITFVPKGLKWGGAPRFTDTDWGMASWCQGGGWIMSRECMEQIVNSKKLLNPCYKESQGFEARRQYEDCRLGHVANSLGIYPESWPGVTCQGIPKGQVDPELAIIHPVKNSAVS